MDVFLRYSKVEMEKGDSGLGFYLGSSRRARVWEIP
jgi:hypothetical protein